MVVAVRNGVGTVSHQPATASWFVLVLRYCEPRYGRLPLIQAGQGVESVASACRSLHPQFALMELAFRPPRDGPNIKQ
jgi:hypothetical protein